VSPRELWGSRVGSPNANAASRTGASPRPPRLMGLPPISLRNVKTLITQPEVADLQAKRNSRHLTGFLASSRVGQAEWSRARSGGTPP
jgi:hypothetical protein